MISPILLVTWTQIYYGLTTTSEEYNLSVFDNTTSGSQHVPSWGPQNVTWEKTVAGASTNVPSWSTGFTSIVDSTTSENYSGGGESVPAHYRRTDYVPYQKEVGNQSFRDDQEPPNFAIRDRLWKTPSAKTFRLTNLQGNPGGGN